jgi:hypothetical protein
MNSNIRGMSVQIVKFVDNRFPGWLECEFVDAEGYNHRLIDKVPLFTTALLDATSGYPQSGIARCEILGRSRDDKNRELVTITTARPDTVESTEGLSEFVVLSTQLQPDPWPAS